MKRLVLTCVVSVALLIGGMYGLRSAEAGPPAPPQAVTADVAVGSPIGVTLLTDPGYWDIAYAKDGCIGGLATVSFENTSSASEYLDTLLVAPGGNANITATATNGASGLAKITAGDGQTSVYFLRDNLSYECRVTAQIAVAPQFVPKELSAVSATGFIPADTDTPESVLFASGWSINLGTGTPNDCFLGAGDTSFVFLNTSSKDETIQGGPYATPTTVAGGASANLGTVESWPNPSDPVGALVVTAGKITTTAYLTGGFESGGGCWGTGNLTLLQG